MKYKNNKLYKHVNISGIESYCKYIKNKICYFKFSKFEYCIDKNDLIFPDEIDTYD